MKKPEEIKAGLGACQTVVRCSTCTYHDVGDIVAECTAQLSGDALVYIQQLESRLAQVERERDAAVNDLRDNYEPCDVCKKKNICEQYCPKNGYDCVSCLDTERCIFYNCTKDNDLWEWRGVCTENTKEE